MVLKKYMVVCSGNIIAGYSDREVKATISTTFKLKGSMVDRLFSGGVVTVKKNVDYQTAIKYKSTLEKAGAICSIVPAAGQPDDELLIDETTHDPEDVVSEDTVGEVPVPVFDDMDEREGVSAGFWLRLVAFQLDLFILFALTVLIKFGLAAGISARTNRHFFFSLVDIDNSLPLTLFFILLLPLCYSIVFWVKKGATPGKMILGLQVINYSGNHLSFGKAFLRHISYSISILPLFLGFFWTVFSFQKRGWHDYCAGSRVVWAQECSLCRIIIVFLIPWAPILVILTIGSVFLLL